jgi:DNA-binding transcriptional LysR family regulator
MIFGWRRWALYASRDYVRRRRAPSSIEDLAQHAIIGWAETAPEIKAQVWLGRHVPAAAIGFRTSTLVNQWTAAREGLGIAVLPLYLAADTPGLVRLIGPLESLVTELWIITHRSLKDTARVRSFMEFVSEGVRCRIATLEGRSRPAIPVAAPRARYDKVARRGKARSDIDPVD